MDDTEATSESASAEPTKDERTWGLIVHLGGTVLNLLTGGLAGWILPLVVFLTKRDESEFVADQAKEALNFRITLLIGYLLCIPLYFILIGVCFAIAFWIAELVFGILAAVRAYDGERYRYPFAFRLVN